MKPLWFYRIHWRPTIWEDMTPEETEPMTPHSDYMKRLYDEGRVVLGGFTDDPLGAYVFLDVNSRHQAERLMKGDPLFAAGIVKITLHEFSAGFIGGTPYDFMFDQEPDESN
jgi:uncharacterized protein YciI